MYTTCPSCHGQGQYLTTESYQDYSGGSIYKTRQVWRSCFGNWSGEGELRLPGKWTYRGKFRSGLLSGKGVLELDNGIVFEGKFRTSEPKGKGVLQYQEEFRFEGRWSDATTASGKIYGLEKEATKARIKEGEIQTKKGMFSKWKRAGSFDCRKILSGGKIG